MNIFKYLWYILNFFISTGVVSHSPNFRVLMEFMDFPGDSDGKESACSAGDLGQSPGEGNGHSLQCSCLDNPMDRGAWWATVHRVPKSRTWRKHLSMHACTSSHEKTWRKLRSILLSEKRQLEKATYCVITTLWCYGKCKTMETVKGSVVARGWEWKEEP